MATPTQPDKFKGTGVSLPESTLSEAQKRAAQLGFENFSAYVAALIQCDLHSPDGWLHIPPKRPKK